MTTNPSVTQTPTSARYAEAAKILLQLKEDVKKYGTLEAPDETQQKTINSQFDSFKNGIASQFPKEVSTTLFTKMNRVFDKFDRITTKVELVAAMKQIQEFNEGKNTNAPTPDQLKDLLNTPNISPKYVEALLIATEKLAKTADPKSESNNNSNPLIDFTPPPSPKPAHTPTSPSTDPGKATLVETPAIDPNPSVMVVKSASSEPTPPDSPTSTHSKSSASSKPEETVTTDTTPTPTVTHTLSTVASGGGDPSPKHTPPDSPKPTHSSSSGTPQPEEHNLNASPDGKKADQPEIATTTTGTETLSLDITPPASPKTPHVTVSTYSVTSNPDESKKGEDKSSAVPVIDLKTSQGSEKTPEIDSASTHSSSSQEDRQDVLNTSQNPAQGNVSTKQETITTDLDVDESQKEGLPSLYTTSSVGKTETVTTQENNNNSSQVENEPPVLDFEKIFTTINDTIKGQKKDFHSTITKIGEDFEKLGLPNLGHFVFAQAYFFAKKLGWNVDFYNSGEAFVKDNLFTSEQLSTISERAKGLLYLESARHLLDPNINIVFSNPQNSSQLMDSISDMMNDCEKYSLTTANAIYGATWKFATDTEKKHVLDFGKHAFKGTKDAEGKVLYPISLETKQAAVKAVINDCKRNWNNN